MKNNLSRNTQITEFEQQIFVTVTSDNVVVSETEEGSPILLLNAGIFFSAEQNQIVFSVTGRTRVLTSNFPIQIRFPEVEDTSLQNYGIMSGQVSISSEWILESTVEIIQSTSYSIVVNPDRGFVSVSQMLFYITPSRVKLVCEDTFITARSMTGSSLPSPKIVTCSCANEGRTTIYGGPIGAPTIIATDGVTLALGLTAGSPDPAKKYFSVTNIDLLEVGILDYNIIYLIAEQAEVYAPELAGCAIEIRDGSRILNTTADLVINSSAVPVSIVNCSAQLSFFDTAKQGTIGIYSSTMSMSPGTLGSSVLLFLTDSSLGGFNVITDLDQLQLINSRMFLDNFSNPLAIGLLEISDSSLSLYNLTVDEVRQYNSVINSLTGGDIDITALSLIMDASSSIVARALIVGASGTAPNSLIEGPIYCTTAELKKVELLTSPFISAVSIDIEISSGGEILHTNFTADQLSIAGVASEAVRNISVKATSFTAQLVSIDRSNILADIDFSNVGVTASVLSGSTFNGTNGTRVVSSQLSFSTIDCSSSAYINSSRIEGLFTLNVGTGTNNLCIFSSTASTTIPAGNFELSAVPS